MESYVCTRTRPSSKKIWKLPYPVDLDLRNKCLQQSPGTQRKRTWQLKLSQSPTTAEIVFVFIHFTKTRTVSCVVRVSKPMFLGAVSGPPAIRTFESDRLRLSLRVIMCVVMM